MNRFLLTTSIGLALCAGGAAAQSISFEGAELSYEYVGSDDNYYGERIIGSAEISFAGIGMQLDAGQAGYDGNTDYNTVGLHVNYGINDNIVAGAFYTRDDWTGDIYESFGLEGMYTTGAFSVEAAAGKYGGSNISYDTRFIALNGAYEIGSGLSATANLVSTTGDDDLTIVGLGARYERSGFFTEVGVAQFSGDYDHQVLSLEVGYAFGGGTTFDQRDWNGILGLY